MSRFGNRLGVSVAVSARVARVENVKLCQPSRATWFRHSRVGSILVRVSGVSNGHCIMRNG